MSIPVDLAALDEELGRRDTAYLLVSGEARPHVVQVSPELVEGVLMVAQPGRTARRVIVDRPSVSLLLPPGEVGGYSLIIDGEGSLDTEGRLQVTPSTAVLHRSGPHEPPSPATDCGNDCRPLQDAAPGA